MYGHILKFKALAPLPGDIQRHLLHDIQIEPEPQFGILPPHKLQTRAARNLIRAYRQRFRRSVLHDAPLTIDQISVT